MKPEQGVTPDKPQSEEVDPVNEASAGKMNNPALQNLMDVMCPECAHEFFIPKD